MKESFLRARQPDGAPFYPEIETGISGGISGGSVLLAWSVDGAECAVLMRPARIRELATWLNEKADEAEGMMPKLPSRKRRWWQFLAD